MATVISDALVLGQIDLVDAAAPRLCWRNIVTEQNVSATSSVDEEPVTNIANPSTAFGWQAASTDMQEIDITVNESVDYIGIARHNLRGNGEIRIRVLGNGVYTTVVDWTRLSRKRQTVLFLINDAAPQEVQIQIRNNSEAPRLGVVYIGRSTRLQRNIYVGHTPVTLGRDVQTVGGFSENGQYLGELVRREGRSTSVELENLTPDWYRRELDPFIAQRPRAPAFFAWRPDKYSAEVGYVWLTGSPRPSNQRPNGMMQISMDFEAIA